MRKCSLEDPVSKYYDKIDQNTIELKGGFMGLCTEVDRYFRLSFNIDLTKPVLFYHSDKFIDVFPNLANMSHAQLEQLRVVYCEIRNINAHLFLNKPIYISQDLIVFLTNIAKPRFSIFNMNELTMYGMLFILSILSQKYQLWPFLSECFKSTYFTDFSKKETSKMQTEMQHFLQEFCGTGKPIYPSSVLDKVDLQYFNDTCKRYMTKIFFALEKSILGWSLSGERTPSFGYLLKSNSPFSTEKDLRPALTRLRNFWFHGKAVFDTSTTDREVFSLEFIISVFIKLKKAIQNNEKYKLVEELLVQFGEKLIHFYILRIVEVSYKLLDNRLLTEEKINSRITDINRAVSRFENAPNNYIEMAVALVEKDDISYAVGASKFLDFVPRTTKARVLHILKIKSKECICIGGFNSHQNEVCIALVDLDNEFMNKINGHVPNELKCQTEKFYSKKICIYDVFL